jgi:tripartite-type tricarboxylate transporter receptor subunit TctC
MIFSVELPVKSNAFEEIARMRTNRSRARVFAFALLLATASHAKANDAVENFYKGRTINSVVPFGPGGGYATYSQVVARHIGRHIPGHPQIVLQYRPGAGGMVASNYMYNAAPRDGSVMAMLSDSVALASVIEAERIKYKVNEFIWLGAIERVNNVLGVRADSGVRNVRDMLKTETIVGSSGAGSPTFLLPSLLAWLEPVKIKTIFGFSGVNPILLAIERNEIAGVTVSWSIFKSLRKQWFESGYMVPVVQFGSVRQQDLPKVPLALDFAKTPEQKAVARFMASNVDIGRSFVVPPAVPAERVAALRAAFDRMGKDPAFIAEAVKAGIDLSPATGAQVQEAVAQATKIDDGLARVIRETISKAK